MEIIAAWFAGYGSLRGTLPSGAGRQEVHAAELLFQLGTPINVFLSDEMHDGSGGRPIFEGCRLLPIREFMELWSAPLSRLADRRYGVPCDKLDGPVRAVPRSRY